MRLRHERPDRRLTGQVARRDRRRHVPPPPTPCRMPSGRVRPLTTRGLGAASQSVGRRASPRGGDAFPARLTAGSIMQDAPAVRRRDDGVDARPPSTARAQTAGGSATAVATLAACTATSRSPVASSAEGPRANSRSSAASRMPPTASCSNRTASRLRPTGDVVDRRGTWTPDDRAENQCAAVAFEVPRGVGAFRVELEYEPRDGAVLDLGCEGPEGYVGWSAGHGPTSSSARSWSTPGYLPTPVRRGRGRCSSACIASRRPGSPTG